MLGVLYIVYQIIININAIVGGLYYNRMDRPLKIFYLLILAICISENISLYLRTLNIDAPPVSHIYSIFEICITTIYFLYTIFPNPKKYLVILTIIFSIIFGLVDILFERMDQYNNYMIVVESLFICPQALYVLYIISNRDDILKLSDYPHFYIWRSLLIWWSVTFFYWAFSSYIRGSNRFPIIKTYYVIFNIIVYMLIFITLVSLKKKKSNPIILT